ncbi:MAG: hypothetical protein JWM47_3940 [Acidimicrobiales bacterium]|nr:hypothetical protein [Acidimicrobiales bacterium]
MASTTQHHQGLVAAGCGAPALSWPVADAASAENRHHVTVMSPIPAAYEVKPSVKDVTFMGITRRPTEGSS